MMGFKMSNEENYEFEIGDEGLDYASLDSSFNPSTQAFIIKAGIKPGMKVLDIGCGAGAMTEWLATQVGPKGKVIAVDNSHAQLAVTQKRIQRSKLANVETKVLSAYEIDKLEQKFDLIYSRFLLHHLHSPRKAVKQYFNCLSDGGLYIGEEGMMNMAFAYPPSIAWQGYHPQIISPDSEVDGQGRDGDIGMKIFYICKQSGFKIQGCNIVQPVLWQEKQKIMLRDEMQAYKKTELAKGTSEAEWQKKRSELERLSKDDNQILAFYGSFQVAARKPNVERAS